jgi:hypothetical protein
LESAQRFARPYARLFPLLNKRVWTPKGPGVLEQVLSHEIVRVALDTDRNRMIDFLLDEVLPLV